MEGYFHHSIFDPTLNSSLVLFFTPAFLHPTHCTPVISAEWTRQESGLNSFRFVGLGQHRAVTCSVVQ